MFKVTDYKQHSATEFEVLIDAPRIAAKAKPGQFVIVQRNETSERIPLTICETLPEQEKIRIIFQVIGKSTYDLAKLRPGDELFSLAGPLGKPTEVQNYGTVLLVGGGVGIAALYPIVKGLKNAGNRVITILGAKNKDFMILADECEKYSDELILMTDDGTLGRKGLVTEAMEDVLKREKIDCSWAIGPGIMMRFCTQTAHKYDVPTYVSLNPIMIDGTGMCGGCRVSVGDDIKFACVDGPEFLGDQVDWDTFMNRMKQYHTQEKEAYAEVKEG
ncbi:sulfide/dihydroorotate dehydrogenase-like FAD/NAD-binding protein [Agrilactobacillus yilanensis]|uniref:Sulfide/dihydroorotate dehydrogenase-like FAD/NAD-binding protein n=1 Tax=Agrilactobacillus yilanensis TaxID=2485997 RepID=A0ABW4J6S6_9LACO|nr:sulfide/dihydroorotate dehydrogenase-like FAD/NAD-binding protein [Agrilactobacillus yilanensis]